MKGACRGVALPALRLAAMGIKPNDAAAEVQRVMANIW
jgi:hypothetical protein